MISPADTMKLDRIESQDADRYWHLHDWETAQDQADHHSRLRLVRGNRIRRAQSAAVAAVCCRV